MLDHISLGVTDLSRSRRFYDAALRAIGLVRIVDFEEGPESDYGSMPGPLGVEFTITVKPGVEPSQGCTCVSVLRTEVRCSLSTQRRLTRAAEMTDRPACTLNTTRTISPPFFWIPMATE